MPVMDGLEATRLIRGLPGRERLPIVAMTADVLTSDRTRCLAAGMDDFLPKPLVPAQFDAALERWIGPRRAAPRASPPSATLQDIPGLDLEAGLNCVAGDVARFRRTLGRFAKLHRDYPGRIERALADRDYPAARLLAHQLKAAAAQIGAGALRQRAEALEHALRDMLDGDPQPVTGVSGGGAIELLCALEHTLGELLAELDPRLAAFDESASAAASPVQA